MNALFLYPTGGGGFDRKIILSCLRNLNSVSEFEVEPDDFALCTGRFCVDGESNLFELKRSLNVVVLGREGKAALKLAFEIQATYPHPLDLTNESFSFEIHVGDFKTFDDLMREFHQATSRQIFG